MSTTNKTDYLHSRQKSQGTSSDEEHVSGRKLFGKRSSSDKRRASTTSTASSTSTTTTSTSPTMLAANDRSLKSSNGTPTKTDIPVKLIRGNRAKLTHQQSVGPTENVLSGIRATGVVPSSSMPELAPAKEVVPPAGAPKKRSETMSTHNKKLFLGVPNIEYFSDLQLFSKYLEKEPDFAIENDATHPFRFISEATRLIEDEGLRESDLPALVDPDVLKLPKEDQQDCTFEQWNQQMHNLVQLQHQELRSKYIPSAAASGSNSRAARVSLPLLSKYR